MDFFSSKQLINIFGDLSTFAGDLILMGFLGKYNYSKSDIFIKKEDEYV